MGDQYSGINNIFVKDTRLPKTPAKTTSLRKSYLIQKTDNQIRNKIKSKIRYGYSRKNVFIIQIVDSARIFINHRIHKRIGEGILLAGYGAAAYFFKFVSNQIICKHSADGRFG